MEFFDVVLDRKSCLEFEDKEVDEKKLGLILATASHAPTAKNLQEIVFIVVKNKNKKEELSRIIPKKLLVATPIIVCADMQILSNKFGEKAKELAIQDSSFAALALAYASTALGLCSYVLQNFDKEKIKLILSLPEGIEPHFIVLVGYGKEECEELKIDYENRVFVDYYGNKLSKEEKALLEALIEKIKEEIKRFKIKQTNF